MIVSRLYRWFDERLGGASLMKHALKKVFPDHWSFMIGEIAMYCFMILIVTGIYLTLFYVPSATPVVYHGPYKPLDGQTMSAAYESVLNISFQVKVGLLFRQIHHYAALIMMGAIAVHAGRIFFTGAFRKPRDINWVVGVLLLLCTLLVGFAGYSLPDDLLSGTGLRIGYSMLMATPVIGTWLATLLFGGVFPTQAIIPRLYILHVFLLPGAIATLLGVHMAILWHQKHTNMPGPGLNQARIRGERLFPRYALKTVGYFLVLFGVLAALAGLAQINPVWVYGPYNAVRASQASQPDWYMGWTEGMLRIWPNWEPSAFGYMIPSPFFPELAMGILIVLLLLWPFIERTITRDKGTYNILQDPRDTPWRTALGVAVIALMTVLTLAGASDVIAGYLQISIFKVTVILRWLTVVVPPVSFAVAYYIASELRGARVHPVKESKIMTIRRSATGGFETVEREVGGFPSLEERMREAAGNGHGDGHLAGDGETPAEHEAGEAGAPVEA